MSINKSVFKGNRSWLTVRAERRECRKRRYEDMGAGWMKRENTALPSVFTGTAIKVHTRETFCVKNRNMWLKEPEYSPSCDNTRGRTQPQICLKEREQRKCTFLFTFGPTQVFCLLCQDCVGALCWVRFPVRLVGNNNSYSITTGDIMLETRSIAKTAQVLIEVA